MSSNVRFPLATTLLLALAAGASAQDLFVGHPNTVIQRGNPATGDFQAVGACGGLPHSMTTDGDELYIGDVGGRIYRFDDSAGFVGYAFDALNDATALALDGSELLVAGSDGSVWRHDRASGAALGSLAAPVSVRAMIRLNRTVYVGSELGIVYRAELPDGDFEFAGTCAGPIRSLIQHDKHLLLGTDGAVYRASLETGTIVHHFTIANDATGMVLHQGTLLVSGSDSSILRLDPWTGAEIAAPLDSFFDNQAMALGGLAAPGTPYCFGTGCPCGNDDASAGCANSTGQGALLGASGTASVTQDDLALVATGLPVNQFGLFYMGAGVIDVPFGDGKLCAGAGGYGNFRFNPVRKTGASGTLALGPGIAWHAHEHFNGTGQVFAGFTWNFQIWYRDGAGSPCGSHFNLSNAYSTTFTP